MALVLAGLTVPVTARGMDADGPTPLPQLLAFLPWFLVPSWLALLYTVLARRALFAAWAIAVLVATVWCALPEGPDASPVAEESEGKAHFRVLTANLRYGSATEGLLETLHRERPQFASVQECDSRCAEALRGREMREAYPYRIIVDDGGARGSALLSVYPLRDETSVRGRMAMPGAVAELPGARVRVQVAHPTPPKPRSVRLWRTELNRLRDYGASRGKTPTVLAGDFNSSQDHAAFRAILDTGLHDAARLTGQSRNPTWPANAVLPLGAQIDHVLLSESMTAVDARFLALPGTDHRAVLAELKVL